MKQTEVPDHETNMVSKIGIQALDDDTAGGHIPDATPRIPVHFMIMEDFGAEDCEFLLLVSVPLWSSSDMSAFTMSSSNSFSVTRVPAKMFSGKFHHIRENIKRRCCQCCLGKPYKVSCTKKL